MKRNYLGVASSFHDGAIALVDSRGRVVFAEATERYLQNKRAINNVPDQFNRIGKIISRYGEDDAELVVAQTWSKDVQAHLQNDTAVAKFEDFLNRSDRDTIPAILLDQYALTKFCVNSATSYIDLSLTNLEFEISQRDEGQPKSYLPARCYDHHLTHAATACFTSPFREGVCAILDGYGEERSYSCYHYRGGKISAMQHDHQQNPASLGFFYMIICRLCGFGLFSGEEWKVMGLAAYGEFDREIYALLRPLLKVQGLNILSGNFAETYRIYKKLFLHRRRPQMSPLIVANLAHTAQGVFAETLYEYLNNLYEVADSDTVILGGGCLLNSSANGQILENTKFKNAYIFSAPGDDGNAIGAALLAYYEDHPGERRGAFFQSPYLGSTIEEASVENLKKFGQISKLKEYPGAVYIKTAELLSQGKIVGWVQGRAEFGPRALGNRSILADPRPAGMKDAINGRVKFREEFRPFAPSILHEFGEQYFENYQEAPYMERTLRFRREVVAIVPGVVHEDFTGRLQTVKREWNEKYYELIYEFFKITGIPLLLNTSFNIMGKPIMHSLEDAIALFYTTGLDALVIGDVLIEK